MSRNRPVNDKQLEVLRWISEGCPEGRWADHSYKTSAVALQGRGLVVVRRTRGSWWAELTDDGRYYVAHGRYPGARSAPRQGKAREENVARQPAHQPRVEIPDLVERVRRAEGVLRVEDPDPGWRAAYRRAIHTAITTGAVPEGYRLRHTGRDRGDLLVRLVPAEQASARRAPLPSVPIPDSVDEGDELLGQVETAGGLAVSAEQRPRALGIIRGMADEAHARGYGFGSRPDGAAGFCISIGEDSFDFTVWEETDKVDQYPEEEEVAAKKYPWQRVSARRVSVPSGRLVLRLDAGYRPPWWADRKRWRLSDKLAEAFLAVEECAASARQAREQERQARLCRREQWDVAVPEARARYVADLNRTRVAEQARAWRQASDLRGYAAAVQAQAENTGGQDEQHRLGSWAEWARQEADRLDPLRIPEVLGFDSPEQLDPAALDAYMPAGMTVRHPPDTAPRR